MPFLRKITGSHSRSSSSSSVNYGFPTHQQQQQLQQPSTVLPSPPATFTHSKENSITSIHSNNSTSTSTNEKSGPNNNNSSVKSTPKARTRKKPPPLKPTKISSKNSLSTSSKSVSQQTIADDDNNSNINTYGTNTSVSSTLLSPNKPYTPSSEQQHSKRASTSTTSALPDDLTLYTYEEFQPVTPFSQSKGTNSVKSHSTLSTPTSTTGNATFSPNLNQISTTTTNNSRKSSSGEMYSTDVIEKFILSWDPTNPMEWTLQRVLTWLRFHDFPDSWISYFKKHQLFGHKFIKLLVYDNFQKYEDHLIQCKEGSYVKFQDLLKRTMSNTVNNNHHIRQRSLDNKIMNPITTDGTISIDTSTRSSSDSLQRLNSSQITRDNNGSRSASDSSASSPIQSTSSRSLQNTSNTTTTTTTNSNNSNNNNICSTSNITHEEKLRNLQVKSPHQRTKSASNLYRRSFISLRGSTASPSTNNSYNFASSTNPKLNNTEKKSTSNKLTTSSSNSNNNNNNNNKSINSHHSHSHSHPHGLSNYNKSNNIKLNIPQKHAYIDTPNVSPGTTQSSNSTISGSTLTPNKSNTSPLSPSYPGLFRRQHKSSSSESSLLNVIFGSSLSTPTNSKNYTNNGNNNSTLPFHIRQISTDDSIKSPTHQTTTSSTRSIPSITQSNNTHSKKISSDINNQSNTHKYNGSYAHSLDEQSLTGKTKRNSIPNGNAGHSRTASNSITPTTSNPAEVQANMLRNPKTDDKETLWVKLKRRSQIGMGSSSPGFTQAVSTTTSTSTSSLETLTNTSADKPSKKKSSGNKHTKKMTSSTKIKEDIPELKLEEKVSKHNDNNNTLDPLDKYAPVSPSKNNKSNDNDFILFSKDSISFIPINIIHLENIDQLKGLIHHKLGINSDIQITIHMTDFNNNIGKGIPDDVLETFRANKFIGTTSKFHIKEIPRTYNRRNSILQNEPHHALRSVKSKNSVRSVASSMVTDDVSIITSSSDVTSSEDHGSSIGGRRYPQTPSIYYDAANLTSSTNNPNEELNYWNFKDHMVSHSDNNSKSSVPENSTLGSFQVLMKDNSKEIDFNKRRESPYVIPKLAPKRDAPKPPTNNASPQKSNSQKQASDLNRRRRNTSLSRHVAIPTDLISSSQNDASRLNVKSKQQAENIVTSYTPGSTQVMVPQPYKGATETSRKMKSDTDNSAKPMTNFIMKQRANRSNSTVSTNHSIFNSSRQLLRGGTSRRVVSSASAADVFDENDITFTDAPKLSDDEEDNDTDSSDSDDIIWSKKSPSNHEEKSVDNSIVESINEEIIQNEKRENSASLVQRPQKLEGVQRKMTLRPSPEEVYENLEKFFPHANLDKPVVEGVIMPGSPKSPSATLSDANANKSSDDRVLHNIPDNRHKLLRRTKTIRAIAHEASEARKNTLKLKRHNTKMWGTRVVEVTEKHTVSINKAKNAKGEYKEFAWMKGEIIGKGSFGAVYLSLNLTTGEMMAVKQVEVPKYSSQDQNMLDMVEALKSEVSTLKDIDHVNIVQYLGFEQKSNIYSLFLEYVAGGSVGSLIRLYGRFDEAIIRHLTIQVLRGLAYLHSRGILHRDMKADNLLLDQDGVCKISDFGISRKSKDVYANSDMTMRGTVFWMAPEMVDTKQGYSAKVDIWSLGCVVLEMYAGKRPWSNLEVIAAMFKIGKFKSAPPIPEDTLPLISGEGRQFLDECFKIDPQTRPTADVLLEHPFSKELEGFDFQNTELQKFIKSNDKTNSTKLRVTSQERKLNSMK